MNTLLEHLYNPYEGYFWIIDGKIIGTLNEVDRYNFEITKSDTHENSWNRLKPDTCDKAFDYYPRGRVMIDPEYKGDGSFDYFSCMVFIDPCLNNSHDKNIISDFYNLDIPAIPHINWMGNLQARAGINHYSCHNCRDKS